jgi:hypothetical protein
MRKSAESLLPEQRNGMQLVRPGGPAGCLPAWKSVTPVPEVRFQEPGFHI